MPTFVVLTTAYLRFDVVRGRQPRSRAILHPDILEEGPRIGSPADHNAAGLFVGGPQLAINGGWLRLIGEAEAPLEMPAPDTTRAAKRRTRAEKRTLRRRAELEAAMACRRAIMTGEAA